MKIEAFIISWEGKQLDALNIAEVISKEIETTVIDSNKKEQPFAESGRFSWKHVSNDMFYGKKFQTSLDLLKDDSHMLQIQADAECADWIGLIRQLKTDLLLHPEIGVWSPLIDFTPYALEDVELNPAGRPLSSVIQTDGIVWAIHSSICKRLKSLDYAKNNLGWGIDWAAICMSRASGRIVVCNQDVFVRHPRGPGYDTTEADRQMRRFIDGLQKPEKDMYHLLSQLYFFRKKAQKKPRRWYKKIKAALPHFSSN